MNELDLDKLLSMEDPLPAAKPKPEPKPELEAPAPPPVEPEPAQKPAGKPKPTKPQRLKAFLCITILLAVGIALGHWWKTIPRTEPPLYTTSPITTVPTVNTPEYKETRQSRLLQENGHFLCYAYTERIDTVVTISTAPIGADIAVWDGTTLHIPHPAISSFAPQYNIYNVWLRIELAEKVKELFSGSTPALDPGVEHRTITPYRLPGSKEIAGWFILARVYQPYTATLRFDTADLSFPITLEPVYDSLNLKYITTEELVDIILADEKLWEAELPYPFSREPLLKDLLNRTNNIEILLQLLDKSAAAYDADIALKAVRLLEQKELAAKLTDEQRTQFLRLTGQYIQQDTYGYPLEIVTYPHTGTTVFEDKATYWIVSPETPAELGNIPQGQLNCFIRVSLLDHTREQYGDGLTLSLESDDSSLGTRAYYDENGLAGWFVYGHLESFRHIIVLLQTASKEHLQSLIFSADPIPEYMFG